MKVRYRKLQKLMVAPASTLRQAHGSGLQWFLSLPNHHGDRSETSGSFGGNLNVLLVLRLRFDGWSIHEIAARLGVGHLVVRALLRNTLGDVSYQLPEGRLPFGEKKKRRAEHLVRKREMAEARRIARASRPKPIYKKKWIKGVSKDDPVYVAFQCAGRRIRNKLRNRLRKHVHGVRHFPLVGCNRATFRSHIESLFEPGMTWANYGKHWHIDHRVELYRLDLTDENTRRAASHWTNLRPLTAAKNLSRQLGEDAFDERNPHRNLAVWL